MAMMMPPQGITPAFAGQNAQPFPGQSAPVRRDRTVRAPGTRGGHYRRVWSERKHKFYIKYGDAPDLIRVRNAAPQASDSQRPDIEQAADQTALQSPEEKTNEPTEQGQLFEGFYQLLLDNIQIGPEGSAPKTGGKSVGFGEVTPLNGEIAESDNDTLFLLLDERGKKIKSIRREIFDEHKEKDFFCFLTAIHVVNEFLQKLRSGEPMPYQKISQGEDRSAPEAAAKSLVFPHKAAKNKRGHISRALRYAARNEIERQYKSIKKTQPPIPSGLPFNKISDLKKSLHALIAKPQQKATKQQKSFLEKRLLSTQEILEKLEKSFQLDMSLVKASAPGRLRGVAGGGRSHTSVFRRPGRPPGTSHNLSLASSGIHAPLSQRTLVKESKEDWKNHKDLKIGARVKVQHPHSHQRPTWGRIVSIGNDGVSIVEDNGRAINIRWPHIHDIMPLVQRTPQNIFEINRYGVPMSDVPVAQKHEEEIASKLLRRYGMPHNDDMIHDAHEKRKDAYIHLIENGAPIDPVRATASRSVQPSPIDSFKGNLIDSAIARRVPVDPDLLRRLPIESVVEVLHHHFNKGSRE